MKIESCMTRQPVAVLPETRVGEAMELMSALNVRHLPVVDREWRFVGIVSYDDARDAAVEYKDGPGEPGVLGITELGTATLNADDTSEQAWAVLSRSPDLNPLPVVRGGVLVGTVSQRELLRVMAGLLPREEPTPRGATALLREWADRSTPAGRHYRRQQSAL